MNKHSDPLDAIIDFAWAAGADRFWINNAKDELKRLRNTKDYRIVGWGRINPQGILYDLRTRFNPYNDPNIVVPLYSDDIRLFNDT
jgi:hypothetical protein